MEFTINSDLLVKELGLLAGVVEKSSTIPVLANVLIEASASADEVILTATDLETALKARCPAAVRNPGDATLPARRLLDYVKLLAAGDLHMKFSADTHWGSLTCGSAKCRMAGISRDSFPELPRHPKEALMEMPIGVLAAMISRTAFAISAEESRFTMQGALLEMDGARAVMVATDGHRLSLDSAEDRQAKPLRVLLPKKAAAQLAKLASMEDAKALVRFGRDSNHLFFELGSRLLMAREMSGNFPDYARVLPKEQPHCVRFGREILLGAIGRVREFADEGTQMIRLRFAKDELTLLASDPVGESEEGIAIEYSGPEVDIGFNAGYLVEFLRVATGDDVSFLFKDSQAPGELRPVQESDGYRYVVMPMRV